MASKWPPVKNAAFTFKVTLFAQSDNQIKTTPTLAAGDFKVVIDDGSENNLATLPSESPAGSGLVKISLSQAEMNGDEIVVKAHDASGAEWHDASFVIHTVGQALDTIDSNVDSILTQVTGLNDVSTADILAMTYEGSESFQDWLQFSRAVLYGLVSGGGTSSIVFKAADGTTTRITATVDSSGNRSVVSLNP